MQGQCLPLQSRHVQLKEVSNGNTVEPLLLLLPLPLLSLLLLVTVLATAGAAAVDAAAAGLPQLHRSGVDPLPCCFHCKCWCASGCQSWLPMHVGSSCRQQKLNRLHSAATAKPL
jgi:hypothetical protein